MTTLSVMNHRPLSPEVTRARALLAWVGALLVCLFDPLHLVRLEGRLGEVQ